MENHFNSIKVRLERACKAALPYRSTYFNSIKVRLEQAYKQVINRLNTFQFHKGTIRTQSSVSSQAKDSHFNSIKVRLEQRWMMQKDRSLSISIP